MSHRLDGSRFSVPYRRFFAFSFDPIIGESEESLLSRLPVFRPEFKTLEL
jgi:hypothetical protein